MAKFCGQCGAQLNDNATFCTQCGATIAPQQPAQQTASPMANLQQAAKNIDMNAIKDAVSVENIKNLKNKPNKLTIAVLAVLLVLVILVVVILCMIFGGKLLSITLWTFSMTATVRLMKSLCLLIIRIWQTHWTVSLI